MTFVEKLENLKNELSNLNLKVTKGQHGMYIEDVENGSFYSIDGGEISAKNLIEINPIKVVCYED